MIDLSQHGYTHDQIVDSLGRKTGMDSARYGIEILRNTVVVGVIGQQEAGGSLGFTECTLECDSENEVKYSASITMADDPRINWQTDLLRPVMFWPWQGLTFVFRFVPLMPVTVADTISREGFFRRIEAYDESVVLQGNSLDTTLLYEQGTPYLKVIKEMITQTGFTNISIAPSDKALATDRMFEAGEERLEIANTLLSEINYRSLEMDQSGVLVSSPYRQPSISEAQISYTAGRYSLLEHDKEIERDSFKRYNRFIGYCTNPDLEEPLRAVFTNTSPGSPTSTINQRGRIITAPPIQYNNVADQETLAALVQKQAAEVAASYRYASIGTAISPQHTVFDVLTVSGGGISGIWEETAWSIDFAARTMQHQLRSVSFE